MNWYNYTTWYMYFSIPSYATLILQSSHKYIAFDINNYFITLWWIMILNTRRRDSLSVIIMKRKINIINALLFIVTFFFGCLFFANLVHFITNPEISNTSRQGKNLRLHGNERQTHPKLSRAAKSANLRIDTGPQPFEATNIFFIICL